MEKIRLAFIGGGYQAQVSRISRYYKLKDECELVALAEVKPRQAELVAKHYGIKEVYYNHKELLKKANVDAYVITQMYTRHLSIVPDFLKTGKPIFTEKPLAYSIEAGEKLVEISREYNATHVVGYQMRVSYATQYVKRIMDEWQKSGEFGRLQYIRMTAPAGDCYAGNNDPILTDEPLPNISDAAAEVPQKDMCFDKNGTDPYNWFVNGYSHWVDCMSFYMDEPVKLCFSGKDALLLVLEGTKSKRQGIIEVEPLVKTVLLQPS